MRVYRKVAVVVLLGCVACKASPPPPPRTGAPVDLWKLAPDGTVTATVVTLHGFERLGAAMRVMQRLVPERFQPEPGDASLEDSFPLTKQQPPASVGLIPDSTMANFRGPWGVIEVWQTSDARRFNAARHGVTKDGVDHFDNEYCKEVRGVYACSKELANLERLGNGTGLPPPKTPAGMRPDVVLVSTERTAEPMTAVAALVDATGPLVLTAQLDDGVALVDATIAGRPRGSLATLVAAPRHRLRTEGLSGFAAASLDYLATIPPPHNESQEAIVQIVAGEAWTPVGDGSAQITAELRDAAPVARNVASCGAEDSDGMFTNDPAHPDACTMRLPAPLDVEAVLWVEGKQLRVAGTRGPAPPPSTRLATTSAIAPFLDDRAWTLVAWARGVAATSPARSAGVFGTATPELLRVASHVNELAIGVDVRADGIDLRAAIRTSHGEPDAVRSAFDRALEGAPMTLPDALAAFATAHPTARLADDVRAGASGGHVTWYAILMAGSMLIATVPELSARME